MMKKVLIIVSVVSSFGSSCGQEKISFADILPSKEPIPIQINSKPVLINPEGKTIASRFNVPNSFERVIVHPNSFGEYLRNLPLKEAGSLVHYFNGSIKENHGVYDAVVDMDIGKKNLQQCADAVMRLRAEYLFHKGDFEQIHFNFTNGFRVDYSEWRNGKRMVVEGNRTYWRSTNTPSKSYESFREYMELIFNYAGTLSLSKELEPVDINGLQIGDVFIQGGSPGHAVIVVDVAINKETNKKLFLLAQSYMPAQETQILKNPNNPAISPWYNADFYGKLNLPEWTFKASDLKRF
jgi:hypothetical protein